MAMSPTVAAIGPAVSRVWEIGAMPCCEYRPSVGRNDAQPLSAQGILTDPPVSVPSPAVTMRAPITAPVPDGEPPALLVVCWALRPPGSLPVLTAALAPEL